MWMGERKYTHIYSQKYILVNPRSGKYCYKPLMNKTCCPHYTIKCKALEFKATKSQKKVLKHMTKYLTSDIKMKEMHENEGEHEMGEDKDGRKKESPGNPGETVQSDHHKQKHEPRPGLGADANKPPCRKAKLIRKERKLQKLAAKGSECDSAQTSQAGHQSTEKSLEEFLFEYSKHPNNPHKLEVKLVRADMESEEFMSTFKESFSVYKNYQVAIHKEPPEKCTERQFQRFLCDSPLMHHKGSGAPEMGFGSFHQQYYLDGVLIAVGVLDILPRCASSVYLFYEPSYGFLSLGTYSALREIYFTRQLYQQAPSIDNYYMGYYIHSCPKMRYKGNYYPSFLVCPETYNWVPIEKCRPKLDKSKYSRLDDESPVPPITNIKSVLILHQRQVMPYQIYTIIKATRADESDDSDDDNGEENNRNDNNADDSEAVQEYANLVGPTVARRMLLFRA